MQIDWTTFALEIINFLALVWILKRFLYKPVLETLARRRAGIEQTLAEAKASEARAADLQAQFEHRLADWEKEKAAARAQLDAELAAEREHRMQALDKALVQERERAAAQDAHRQETRRRELETQSLAQARAFVSRLLARLAGPELEARLVEVFIEDFAKLSEDRLAGLRGAGQAREARVAVTTAFALPEPARGRITAVIAARLGLPLPVDFAEDAKLLAGLCVSVGPWRMNLSLADELAAFAAAGNHAD